MSPLDYLLPYHPVYDAVRVFCVFAGVAIIVRVSLMVLSGEGAQANRNTRSVMVVYYMLGLYLILQQAQQLGDDLLIWRLPLLVVLGSAAIVTLFTTQQVRGKQVNRTTTQYLVARAAVEDALCDRDRLTGKPCHNLEHDHHVL